MEHVVVYDSLLSIIALPLLLLLLMLLITMLNALIMTVMLITGCHYIDLVLQCRCLAFIGVARIFSEGVRCVPE